jgi:hypothetical protein
MGFASSLLKALIAPSPRLKIMQYPSIMSRNLRLAGAETPRYVFRCLMVRRGFDESFSTAPPNLLPLIPLIPEKSADLAPAQKRVTPDPRFQPPPPTPDIKLSSSHSMAHTMALNVSLA